MPEILEVRDLSAGYGEAQVLHGMSFAMEPGTALALLGRNGVGKTTLINTIVGLTRWRAGSIRFDGEDVTKLRADERARRGIGWVPQERNIFKSLTVDENLTAIMRDGPVESRSPLRHVPAPRRAARATWATSFRAANSRCSPSPARWRTNPKLLLLDEPLEGLAPIIVDELLAALRRIVREEKMSAIIVEQSARKVLPLTDNAIILERGQIAWSGVSADLAQDHETLAKLLGVAEKSAA